MVKKLKRQRFPLHLHITTLAVLLILFLGGTLSLYNYLQTTELIRSASTDFFEQTRHEIELEFQKKYAPIAQTVNLLTQTGLPSADNLTDRLQNLPMLAAALKDRPELTALEVGYQNGDFFIVRVLNDQHMRKIFDAPDNAILFVDNIQYQHSDRVIERVFFDQALLPITAATKISTEYDPRKRHWYQQALQSPSQGQLTAPYLYYFIRKVGVTYSQLSDNGQAVIAADISLDMLAQSVQQQRVTPNSQLLILDQNDAVLAFNQSDDLIQSATDNKVRLRQVDELNQPVLNTAIQSGAIANGEFKLEFADESWQGILKPLTPIPQAKFRLLLLTPEQELFGDAYRIRQNSTLITLALMVLVIPLTWFLAREVSKPLYQLALQSRLIRNFKLDTDFDTHSVIHEVSELALAMKLMQNTIQQFLSLLGKISAEQDYSKLLALLTSEIKQITNSEGVILYLMEDKHLVLANSSFNDAELDECLQRNLHKTEHCILYRATQLTQTQVGPLVEQTQGFGHLQDHFSDAMKVIAIPLQTRQGDMVGVLSLLVRQDNQNADEQQAFTEALAGFASVALESRQMAHHQKQLLQSFIELIAGAIDAKSAYTGNHCQRVPELTRMLTEAANDTQSAYFKDFQLTDEQWEELHIASWLHDCGKVTTPEYVVDKSTKLETLYDRIHEIRMRFEVLKRDAELEYWQARAKSGDSSELRQTLKQQLAELDDEFMLVAQCNRGGEYQSDEKLNRLKKISQRRWRRTLDDKAGVSHMELERRAQEEKQALPVMEPLLADKLHHLIPRTQQTSVHANRFTLQPTEHQFNLGELYNLSVRKGTLTSEERYIINEHIVQTIVMLEQLPYPKHLKNVPLIAGGHHEKMDGTGYPLGIEAGKLPLTSRIMALADIFEALTAADRPYKKAKSISEAINIMYAMCDEQHIDRDVFELFLTSGVYQQYAQRFLQPSQLDQIDVNQYLRQPITTAKSDAETTAEAVS